MHRLGFELFEVEELCDLLEENKYLRILSVFSHLAASEAKEHDKFTAKQISSFEKTYQRGLKRR